MAPKQTVEVVKKEKKRKGSRDSLPKRLSLEDDDLSSELISICKESNIDISKQDRGEIEDNLNIPDGDNLIIEDKEEIENDLDAKEEESCEAEKNETDEVEENQPA